MCTQNHFPHVRVLQILLLPTRKNPHRFRFCRFSFCTKYTAIIQPLHAHHLLCVLLNAEIRALTNVKQAASDASFGYVHTYDEFWQVFFSLSPPFSKVDMNKNKTDFFFFAFFRKHKFLWLY